jgi:hypothetical protein
LKLDATLNRFKNEYALFVLIPGQMLEVILLDEVAPSATRHGHKQHKGAFLFGSALKLFFEYVKLWNRRLGSTSLVLLLRLALFAHEKGLLESMQIHREKHSKLLDYMQIRSYSLVEL